MFHGLKRIGFNLWRKRVSLEERREARGMVKRPLFALVRSAEKHLADGYVDRLRRRVD
jgi:hypothetical protein